MQAVTPHARIGVVKISVINFEHGVVVPQLYIWDTYSNLWDKVAVLAETSIVKALNTLDGNVQTALVATIQKVHDHVFPTLPCGMIFGIRVEAVIGTKENV